MLSFLFDNQYIYDITYAIHIKSAMTQCVSNYMNIYEIKRLRFDVFTSIHIFKHSNNK
jgi:hypothetical protein